MAERIRIGREYRKERAEHPTLPKKDVEQIVKDHEYKRKLKRCERKVRRKSRGKVNEYAVCRASVKRKSYRVVEAFHPTAFETGIYHVHFVEKGKPLMDQYTQSYDVIAKNRTEAIKEARKKIRY